MSAGNRGHPAFSCRATRQRDRSIVEDDEQNFVAGGVDSGSRRADG